MQTLIYNNFEISIDEQGCYVTNLTFNNKEVFFPRTTIVEGDTSKVRGGNHLCLPHFGGNDSLGLGRHGFARHELWKLTSQTEKSLTFTLENSHPDYKDMISMLEFLFAENKMTTKLTLENRGTSELFVSPAFHPYYKADSLDDVIIDGNEIPYTKDELAWSMEHGRVFEFETTNFKIKQTSSNLDKCVVWTDHSAPFICIEPTYNYQGGLKDEPYKLCSNSSVEFSYTIEVFEK